MPASPSDADLAKGIILGLAMAADICERQSRGRKSVNAQKILQKKTALELLIELDEKCIKTLPGNS